MFAPRSPQVHNPATMSTEAEAETDLRTLHLDSTWLELNPEEEAFFKSETGIHDTEELRKHIIHIQENAYKVSCCSRTTWIKSTDSNTIFWAQVYPYPCIQGFGFTELWICKIPAYPRVLELGKSRSDAIFLDIGCCSKDQLISEFAFIT